MFHRRFHWQHGWFFERDRQTGAVRMTKRREAKDDAEIQCSAEIPADEWASIVASVSGKGESGERWNQALHFHQEE